MLVKVEQSASHQANSPLKEAPFGRVIAAMVTPFTSDGEEINFSEARRLANWLADNGSDGLVIAGTTGESPTISHEEQRQLFQEIRSAVSIPVIAGVGSNNTEEAVGLTRFVSENKLADALLVVSPYYNRPPQSGIYEYYSRIADATELPIIIYNIPVRTGRNIENETILALAQDFSNIRGLKDASGDPLNTEKIIQNPKLPSDFYVYSGDDPLNLQLAQSGSVGAISVASHWAGQELKAMYTALEEGDVDKAEQLHQQLMPSFNYETSPETPNPIPSKAMLRAIGFPEVGYCRSPMVLRSVEDENTLEQTALNIYKNLKA